MTVVELLCRSAEFRPIVRDRRAIVLIRRIAGLRALGAMRQVILMIGRRNSQTAAVQGFSHGAAMEPIQAEDCSALPALEVGWRRYRPRSPAFRSPCRSR